MCTTFPKCADQDNRSKITDHDISVLLFPNSLAEIQKDVEYRIPFTVNNSTISVNVLLPPQFPQEKPVVSVYPPVGHHLVDSNNGTMITSPLINNFGMHSDLGKVIQSLLDEFWKSPAPSPAPMPHPGAESAHGHPRAPAPYGLISDLPLPVPTGDSQVQRIIYTSGLVEGSGDSISNIKTLTAKRSKRLAFRLKYLSLQTDRPCSDNYVVSCLYYHCLFQAGLNGHIYKMPEIPESFPELCDMNLMQLSSMSENEDVLLEFFVSLPQLKQITNDKEELVTSIVDMAKKNLQMEPQLEGKRQEMLYKYEQLTQMKSAFETRMQRQHDLSESCSLSTLQARLKVAAHQAEEESEETAENFLEGRTDIDEFLTSFMEKRTLCHSRRAKEEKLQQSINTHGPFPTSH
uniref:VPS37A subunit of ESCRT-I n=1 Tax=Sparus aurata TaxID=8175 RepID=A0A671U0C2_SPAAU